MSTLDELWAQVVEKVGPERAWRPGMRLLPFPARPGYCSIRLGEPDSMTILMAPEDLAEAGEEVPFMPDFDDDATRGALLGLAREVLGDRYLVCWCSDTPRGVEWECLSMVGDSPVGETSTTEAEAILRAILAAP